MAKRKHADRIPAEFASYEEAAEFWGTHDTADYPGAFRTVGVVAEFRRRYYQVEIEADVVKVLQAKARRARTTVSRLASDLLRQQLTMSA